MKQLFVGLAAVAFISFVAFTPVSAQTKSQGGGPAKGVVASVAADSITVTVGGKALTFNVDAKTDVTAPGAGTATKAAKKGGMKGAKFADLVKVGDEVEVTYKDVSGKMMASAIRVTKKAK